jgi:hypothetical protein
VFVLHDAIRVRLWAVFAVRRLHHPIQAFESIDLLGIAQLGCIGEIRTNGELRGGVNAPSVTHSLSCRNVRTKRTKRTKSPDAVESLSVKGVMGGVGLFFEETQG